MEKAHLLTNIRQRNGPFMPKVVPVALSGFSVTLRKPILIPKKRFTYLSEFTVSSVRC